MGRLAELQRKNLEHLMGAEAMGIIQVDLKFTDPKKMDLGACAKTHSQKLKGEYEAALKRNESDDPEESTEIVSPQERYPINEKRVREQYLGFVEECDRRIRAAQKRLEKTPEENNRTTALMREIGEIQTAYEGAMAEVENLGESGQVDQSMAELAKAEALKAEKLEKERELQQLTETSGASGHQKLRVCDICGAYLSILDSDRRLADHFGGKMHLGYLQLRQTIEEWRTRPHGLNAPSLLNNNPGLTAGLQAAHFGQQRAQAAAAQNTSLRRMDGVVEVTRVETKKDACHRRLVRVAETGTGIEIEEIENENETGIVIVIVTAILEMTEIGGLAMITEVIETRTMMTVVEADEMLTTTIRGSMTTTGHLKTIVRNGEDTIKIPSLYVLTFLHFTISNVTILFCYEAQRYCL
ncbi:hypothetical protein PSTT_11619 [Puccinia striiformis]|uniref:Uncharacterized protein n=1 Tax=Puccinia striiformis TaxID=27350 RepID=A0A2S4UZU2_9BASI|nr:hypothetical protein PSTT_11619 [Puccinia striiformis]